MMMTKEQYIESLCSLHLNLYMFGKKIENPVDGPGDPSVAEFLRRDLRAG